MAETPEHGGSDEPVGRRTFSTSFRGFDQGEVRTYLELLAGEFAKLQSRIVELEGHLQTASQVVPPPMDVLTLTSALGEETAKVLRAAQQAAEDLRLRAEDGAARTLREAQEEAARVRGSAETLLADRTSEAERTAAQLRNEAEEAAAKLRAEATAEAEAVIAQAVETGRDMVGQAQAARERVLADLAKRRNAALTQLEALRTGREELLASFATARAHLDRIVDDVEQADEAARAAVEMVGRSAARAAARAAEAGQAAGTPGSEAPTSEGSAAAGAGSHAPWPTAAGPTSDDVGGPAPPAPGGGVSDTRVWAGLAAGQAAHSETAGLDVASDAGTPAGSGPEDLFAAGAQVGIAAGAEVGFAAGAEAGFEVGAEAGFESGAAVGFEAGTEAAFEAGAAVGFEAGAAVGFEAGAESGFEVGTEEGFAAGSDAGFAAGAIAGLAAGGSEAEEAESASAGRPAGEADDLGPAAGEAGDAGPAGAGLAASVSGAEAAAEGSGKIDVDGATRDADNLGSNAPPEAVADPTSVDAAEPAGADMAIAAEEIGVVINVDAHDLPGEEAAEYGTGIGAPGDGADAEVSAGDAKGFEPAPGRAPYPHDPVPAAVMTGPAVGDPPPGGRVDRLFAQIRADRAGAVQEARDVLAHTDAPAESVVASPDEAQLEPPRSDADESYLQRRDVLVEVALGTTTRALKRALADDQNGTLERLRTVPADAEVGALMDEEDAQVRAWARRATPGLIDGAAAGARLADAGDGGDSPKFDPETVGAVADRLAAELVLPLRRRLIDVLESAAGDRGADTMDRVNSVFREWRSRVDRAVAGAVTESVSAGFVAAVDAGTPVRWVVEDADGPCPDCDDNALSGAQPLGDAFPTGQIAPPAHAGCRCVLARAT